MLLKTLALVNFIFAGSAFAYSTLDCSSSTQNLSYTSYNKVGGARPYQGMITHIEEIKKDNEVIFRKVRREECRDVDFCQIQQPEITDINPENISFSFLEDSKVVISSEGHYGGPISKETYAIKFVMEKETWMLCDSFNALYP